MCTNNEETKQHVFTWKIENFSACAKNKGPTFPIYSPTFTAKSFDETSWCLFLFPLAGLRGREGYTSCYLERKENDSVSIPIECDYILEVISNNGNTINFCKGRETFVRGTSFGFGRFMKRDTLMKTALYNDTLTIRCRLCRNLPENCSYSQNTGTSKFKISNYSFQWIVKNLKSITRQETIKFPCSGSLEIEINIQIPVDNVKISIKMKENFTVSQLISCNFVLLDVEGKERDSRRATHLFETAETWKFPSFIKKSQLDAERDVYIKDGCFTIKCDIAVSDGSIEENMDKNRDLPNAEKITVSAIDNFPDLNKDMKRMYEDKIHTDIKLKAGKEVFPAHKSILCARSPVFLAMFENDMAESQNGEVDILDIDAKTVGLFLEYIYTGTVSDLDCENAMKLIVVADKYQVVSLKNKCAELLSSILSDANVCEILVTADLVQHETLKTSALDYIKRQPKKILNSEKWKQIVKNNYELATETLCEVSTFWGDKAKE